MHFAWKDEHMETFLEMFRGSCVDAPNCSRRRIQDFTHHRRGRRFFLVSNIFRHSSARAKLINSIPTLTISVADILKTSETNWTIERYRYSSFHRSHSLRMNHLRCTSKVQKCKFALKLVKLLSRTPERTAWRYRWGHTWVCPWWTYLFCAVRIFFPKYRF
jgi:hypothetical protein